MRTTYAIERLAAISRDFGPGRPAEKLRLLADIGRSKKFSARSLVLLHDTLYFMRAYPDNARVLGAVRALTAGLRGIVENYTGSDTRCGALLNTGVPASCNAYTYSYAVLRRLSELYPGDVEFDWDEIDNQAPLSDSLALTITTGELRGLEDEFVTIGEWLQINKTGKKPDRTDLEVVLHMFDQSALTPQQQMHVFETCSLPVTFDLRVRGTGRCEISLEPPKFYFQKKPVPRERFTLRPKIKKPLEKYHLLSPAAGRDMMDTSLSALCSRNLEIYPLMYANPADVTIVDCGRGLQVVLAGVEPDFRPALESLLFFIVLKNGVPIAYGPACIGFGCCEMGINLFPEFRGGEIRYVYSQFMRSLYHLARVRYFFLTSYGMGENNPEALRSGAFWFYRKMGFRAANPEVEALAREEEKILKNTPGYRCSMATLRKLSYTEAYLDLSRGACKPLDYENVGMALTRRIARQYGGARARAERAGVRHVIQALEIKDHHSWRNQEQKALAQLAPVLAMLPDLGRWPRRDRRTLAAAIRAKGATREFDYIRKVSGFKRLADGLHAVAARERESRET